MKLGKQIKNRMLAVGMLAIVLFCGIVLYFPSSVKAIDNFQSYFKESHDSTYNSDFIVSASSDENGKIFLCSTDTSTSNVPCYRYYLASDKPFSIKYIYKEYDSDKETERNYKSESYDDCGHSGLVYYHSIGSRYTNIKHTSWFWNYWKLEKIYKEEGYSCLRDLHVLSAIVHDKRDSSFMEMIVGVEGDGGIEGGKDNPILDKNIGTLVLKKSKCYWVKDGSMDVSQRVQWANKTDTDFSLTNNKYAITRIEVKIGNRVTYFGDVEHHGTGKKVDNFGKVYPFKYVIATDNPHDFSFKDMLSASKTDLTKYNAAMLEHEYDLYFRVVCGTAYGTSAEWHCGNWTRYRVTDDPKQDGKNESDNGHFNDNGEWEKDKDTDVDSGGIGNVDDKDDLEDDFNHFKDSENWKDWLNKEGLDLDSAKTFIDQVADVPKMIGDLFSFFPDWVKYSFALGFGLIPVIIVIKFLRG